MNLQQHRQVRFMLFERTGPANKTCNNCGSEYCPGAANCIRVSGKLQDIIIADPHVMEGYL